MSLTPDEQLDEVYHALPEWARPLEDRSLAENISYRFKHIEELYLREITRKHKVEKERNGIINFAAKKLNTTFEELYWEFLKSKHPEPVQK